MEQSAPAISPDKPLDLAARAQVFGAILLPATAADALVGALGLAIVNQVIVFGELKGISHAKLPHHS